MARTKTKRKNKNVENVEFDDLKSFDLITGFDNRKLKKPDFSNVEDVGETFAEKAPRSKEHLAIYCATVLNNRFPYPRSNDKFCIDNDHKSPLDAIWDAYSEESPVSIWYAMRGSGKTYDLSLLSWLESVFKPRCWSTILGGSLEQSTKAVSYLNDLWKMETVTNLNSKLLVNHSVGGRGFKTTHGSLVQALAASTKSVRGPHPQKLRLDECLVGDTIIKTIDGEKQIKNITNKDIIFGWDGCKITYAFVQYSYYVGERQTYKIYFSNGNFINCTDNHKILTTDGYLYLCEIKILIDNNYKINAIGEPNNTCVKNYGIYEITKIEKDKINDVYDLNVPDIHSFMANGIIVHNCDEMEKKIYNGALGQPKTNYGILDNVVISSTLHNPFGLMSEIIDKRFEVGAKLYAWCINEVLEPRGFWTNEEFERRKKQLTIAMLDAEYYLRRPKIGDTIFDFESIDRAYIRGKDDKYDSKVLTEAGIDWGYSCTVLNIVQDPREIFRNVESYPFEYIELTERCHNIAKICIERNIQKIYCDSNPKDSNITLRKILLEHRCMTVVVPVAFNKWKGVGINVLRYLLEKNKFNITDKVCQDKMKKYHYKDAELGVIAKEDDHFPDSLIAWATSRHKILGI